MSLWPKKQYLELFTGSKSLLTFSESANACFTDRLSESAWVMPRVNRTCSLLHLIWDVPGCTCMLSVFLFGLESVSAFCVIDHSLSTLEMKLWLLVKIWFFADSTDDTCIVWWAELPTTALLSIQSVLGDPGSYSEWDSIIYFLDFLSRMPGKTFRPISGAKLSTVSLKSQQNSKLWWMNSE